MSNDRLTGQIRFYRKNHIDLDRPNPEITITDSVAINTGQNTVNFLRNRSNSSVWATTGSDDTANTEILVNLYDWLEVDTVMLLRHNFKNFLIEYFDLGSLSFLEYANVTNHTKYNYIADKSVLTNTIRITVYNTQIADADKEMRQLIIAEKFFTGTMASWPQIKNPETAVNKKVNRTLGGRVNVVEKRGCFSCDLEVKALSNSNDLQLIEEIFLNREGVLLQLSGAKEDQFKAKLVGYRDEDVYLVRPTNEYQNPWNDGIYNGTQKVKMKLEECVF